MPNLFERLKLAWIIIKGGSNMQVFVDLYVALIIAKRRTIETTPAGIRPKVLETLKSLGLDGHGDPLPENQEGEN